SWRKGLSVTPAIGATITLLGSSQEPMRMRMAGSPPDDAGSDRMKCVRGAGTRLYPRRALVRCTAVDRCLYADAACDLSDRLTMRYGRDCAHPFSGGPAVGPGVGRVFRHQL